MIYQFCDNCGVRRIKNKYIYYNCNSGDWYSINEDEHNIISFILKGSLKFEYYKKNFKNNVEYSYIKSIFDNLIYLEIIHEGENSSNKEKKILIYEITQRCNLNCFHCCNYIDGNDMIDLNYDSIKRNIDKIIEWNPKSISITGGEPLVRTDIEKILKYLRKNYNGNIMLSSNGILINKYLDVILKCVDQLDLSLDGVDEESCSKIRGTGVYKIVIDNIKLLKTNKFDKISLSFTCSNSNIHLVSKFRELCCELGVKPIIRGFQPIGKGYINKNKFDKFKYTGKEHDNNCINKNLKVVSCLAGIDTLFIRNDGSIYPCPILLQEEYYIGNLNEIKKFDDLRFERNIFQEIINNKLNKCKTCELNLFCITCPGIINFEINNPLFNIDSRCEKIGREIIRKIKMEA